MKPEQAQELRQMLTRQRVLALAVLVEDEPAIGLLPFAVTAGFDALLVNASDLARHTRGLTQGARFDALVQEPDSGDADPLQIARVTLRGRVVLRDPESGEYLEDEQRYLDRFPDATMIVKELGGFRIYRLQLEAGRMISGFAGALNLDLDSFAELAGA